MAEYIERDVTPIDRKTVLCNISYQIWERRMDKGWSREKLADMIDATGSDTVKRWETREQMPNALFLYRLADALECTVDELLGR